MRQGLPADHRHARGARVPDVGGGGFVNVDQRPDLGLQQHLHLTTELKQGIAILGMSAQSSCASTRARARRRIPFFDEDDWVEPRHPVERPIGTAPGRERRRAVRAARPRQPWRRSMPSAATCPQRSFSFDRYPDGGRHAGRARCWSSCACRPTCRARDGHRGVPHREHRRRAATCASPTDQAAASALGVSEQEVAQRRSRSSSSSSPQGVAARNLAECLALAAGEGGARSRRCVAAPGQKPSGRLRDADAGRHRARHGHLAQRSWARRWTSSARATRVPASQFGRPSNPIWPEVMVVTACGRRDATR